MISVIGTPMIQSNIERIMVSFMSCNKIIRLLPYQLLTSCPVKRHPVSENATYGDTVKSSLIQDT